LEEFFRAGCDVSKLVELLEEQFDYQTPTGLRK